MKRHTSVSSKKRLLSAFFITLTLVALGVVLFYGFSSLQTNALKNQDELQKEANKSVGAPENKDSIQAEKKTVPEGKTIVILETSLGEIKIQLDPEKAPLTVENFLQYVNSGFYDGTIFHRVIPGFVIQGGGLTEELEMKKGFPAIRNEAKNGLTNQRGTIAMARTMFVHSATSQFFINLADNPHLDYKDDTSSGYGYCVFGKVVDGMDVVDRIANVPTHNVEYYSDVPVEPIKIYRARQGE